MLEILGFRDVQTYDAGFALEVFELILDILLFVAEFLEGSIALRDGLFRSGKFAVDFVETGFFLRNLFFDRRDLPLDRTLLFLQRAFLLFRLAT